MMKAILLPTDFSKNSINAIHYAMNLFKYELCEFYLLNVQTASSFISDDLMTMTSSSSVYQTIIGTAKKSINNLIETIESKFENEKHSFYSIVDYDNFVDAVNQVCESKNIDLIVMGTKGATGAKKMLFGSNTVHLMQRCKTPVLAIPNNSNELKPLLEIANRFNSTIEILHFLKEDNISSNKENNKIILDSTLNSTNHKFIELKSNDIFETVHNYIISNKIGLLAMKSNKHSFFERLFNKHLVETFAFKIDIPFLVMMNN